MLSPQASHLNLARLTHSVAERISARSGWGACLAIVAVWFGMTAWLRPLAIPDEGRYVGVAWEMLRGGDWLVPTLDGAPFFHKPPLFYWITAGSMELFGPGVWAARAAAWIAAVASATGLFVFVRRWVGVDQAWLSVAVLATLPIFYGGAQYANADMLVAACITTSILLGAHAALARERGLAHRRALALAFAAAACGVLAKGLIGAVLPVLVLLCWSVATRRAGKVLALSLWAPGWLLFMAIAAPWFIAMQQRHPDFLHYFFVVQHFQRFASVEFNNPQPVWFYLAVIVATTLPWSPWLLELARRRYWMRNEDADLRALMFVWLVVVTAFFSLPNSKLIGYILPAIPPWAFVIADAVRSACSRRTDHPKRTSRVPIDTLRRATTGLAAIACMGIVIAAHYFQPKSEQALAERLQALRRPAEPVVFLGHYYYDVAFYSRLDVPPIVVDAWRADEVAKDSWRRELTDSARFAPPGSARRLLRPGELGAALCGAPGVWFIGPWPAAQLPSLLAVQAPAYQNDATALWHIVPSAPSVRAALNCAQAAALPARLTPQP